MPYSMLRGPLSPPRYYASSGCGWI